MYYFYRRMMMSEANSDSDAPPLIAGDRVEAGDVVVARAQLDLLNWLALHCTPEAYDALVVLTDRHKPRLERVLRRRGSR